MPIKSKNMYEKLRGAALRPKRTRCAKGRRRQPRWGLSRRPDNAGGPFSPQPVGPGRLLPHDSVARARHIAADMSSPSLLVLRQYPPRRGPCSFHARSKAAGSRKHPFFFVTSKHVDCLLTRRFPQRTYEIAYGPANMSGTVSCTPGGLVGSQACLQQGRSQCISQERNIELFQLLRLALCAQISRHK